MMVLDQSRPHRLAAVMCLILLVCCSCGFRTVDERHHPWHRPRRHRRPARRHHHREGGHRRVHLQRHVRQRTARSCSPACVPRATTSRWTMPQYKPASRRLTVLVGQDLDLDFRLTADLVYAENITVVGDQAVDIRTSTISHERHRGADPQPAAERPQLPQLRGTRSRREGERQLRHHQGGDRRRSPRLQHQRLHRRRQLQERHPARAGSSGRTAAAATRFRKTRSRSSACSPRTSRPSSKRPRAPRSPPSPRAAATSSTGDVFLLYQDKALVGLRPVRAQRAAKRSRLRAVPGRRQHRRADRQGQDDVLRLLRNQQAGP